MLLFKNEKKVSIHLQTIKFFTFILLGMHFDVGLGHALCWTIPAQGWPQNLRLLI